MSKMKEKQEKYGAWMVVNRRKPLCKASAKPLMHEGSDLAKSTQRVGVMPTPRVVDQEKKEGKRKANHLQPMVSHKEVEKTTMSNCGISGSGKSSKDSGYHGKSN
nr:hypothetical protein CFP56_02244 [Quercus suber]